MERAHVECLRCGDRHPLPGSRWLQVRDSECPRCGYLGWAPPATPDDDVRRRLRLRELPVARRHLRIVA